MIASPNSRTHKCMASRLGLLGTGFTNESHKLQDVLRKLLMLCRHDCAKRIVEMLRPICSTLAAESKQPRDGEAARILLANLLSFRTLSLLHVFADMTEELQALNLYLQQEHLTAGGELQTSICKSMCIVCYLKLQHNRLQEVGVSHLYVNARLRKPQQQFVLWCRNSG